MNTRAPSLSAVLPLHVNGSYDCDDLARANILFHTLKAFVEPGTFSIILVVVPPSQQQKVASVLEKWSYLNLWVVSEELLLPELASHRHLRGWRKQQLVKLGAHRLLHDDFVLTLDADVVCLKPISRNSLLPGGRALIQYEPRSIHPKWWRSSARLLDMTEDSSNTQNGMSITPALLSRDLAIATTERLTSRSTSWVDRLCQLHNPRSLSNWTYQRFQRCKWTEYSLYYLNTIRLGQLSKYHCDVGTAEVPQRLMTHDSHPFETWDAAYSFSAQESAYFCVVGSKSRLRPQTVWEKVQPFIPDSVGYLNIDKQ